jgi:transglutaminase superfamily protein
MPRPNELQGALGAALLPLCDFAIHVAAWSLLRARLSPLTAHAVLCRAGAWLPAIESAEEARGVARSLIPHGTCLSRSLTLAARAPSADVVIGVSPRGDAPLHAHAWIEMNGAPLEPTDVSGEEIARLRGRRSATPGVRGPR